MGNYFNRCYAEENNIQVDDDKKRVPSIADQEIYGTLNFDENKQIQIEHDQIDNSMIFRPLIPIQGKHQYIYLHIDIEAESIFKNLAELCNFSFDDNSQNFSEKEFINLFNEPYMILSSDQIQQFTSNQFQIQIAMQRYTLGEKYLGFLNETELLIAEAIQRNITTGLIPLFISNIPIKFQNKKLEQLFNGIKIVFLVCEFFQGILKKYLKNSFYSDNIKIYNLIYYQFQKLILNLNYVNQEIYNSLPIFENNYKFSLLGYSMRFWCQRVIANIIDGQNNTICKYLLESFRNVEKKGMELDIYTYIEGAIDLCSNEYTSNWIGHYKNFKIEKLLIDMNHNELNIIQDKDFIGFSYKIDNQLQKCRQFYPTWIFEIKYLTFSLDLKIKKLMEEIKESYKLLNDTQLLSENAKQFSYNELPTGYGLFDENEKADDMESQMIVMAKFLIIDQNVQPTSNKILAQEPYYSVQSNLQEKIPIILPSQLKIQPNQSINEKVKNIKPKYFEDLKNIRIQYKEVLKNIKRRNSILQIRNSQRKIDKKFLYDKNEQSKGYNYFLFQKITNEKIEKFIQKFKSEFDENNYRDIKKNYIEKVDLFFQQNKK